MALDNAFGASTTVMRGTPSIAQQPDMLVVANRSEAKQIRDAIRSATGANATTDQFNCMSSYIHDCKEGGDGGKKNDKGDFTFEELVEIAKDLFLKKPE